jgi:hypothetical protein
MPETGTLAGHIYLFMEQEFLIMVFRVGSAIIPMDTPIPQIATILRPQQTPLPKGPMPSRLLSNTSRPLSRPGSPTQEAVTLIFKDGRPPQQIHNYLLTRSALYVTEPDRRIIPTSQLDLVATVKVNRDAGVDFRLPENTSK